jgi:hypothetical protein
VTRKDVIEHLELKQFLLEPGVLAQTAKDLARWRTQNGGCALGSRRFLK